ncbi:MAG: hypothetical protein P8J86_03895 [Phycisphaerales bacterium]|nr:hypothetical protein [Phycisphaerales bacterium]
MAHPYIRMLLLGVLGTCLAPNFALSVSQQESALILPDQATLGAENADERVENAIQEAPEPDSAAQGDEIPVDGQAVTGQNARMTFMIIQPEGVQQMTITATGWDRNGLVGPGGEISWLIIDPKDVWRLYPRLMGPKQAQTWLDLGHILLQAPDDLFAQKHSGQAFRRAIAIDPAMGDRIAVIKREVAQQLATETEAEKTRSAHDVHRTSPEVGPWPEGIWPPEPLEQRAERRAEVQEFVESVLEPRPEKWKYKDEDNFLVAHGGLDNHELALISTELKKHLQRLDKYIPQEGYLQGSDHFYGPVGVIVSKKQDDFRILEVDAFRQMTGPDVIGITHYKEPIVVLHVSKTKTAEAFNEILRQQLTLGYLHRHISPDRLPIWVQEGVGPALVMLDISQEPIEIADHDLGVRAIRSGANPGHIFSMTYTSEQWPGSENIGPTLGYLTMLAMLRIYPEQTLKWIRAMKFGVPWATALSETMDMTPDQLANLVAQYWRVND